MLAPLIIHPFSAEANNGATAIHLGFFLNTATSATWPNGNTAMAFPFTITEPFQCRTAFLANGAVVSGNFDIGIYTATGSQGLTNVVKIASTGSTVQAGANTLQTVTLSASLVPGAYHAVLSVDNTTGTAINTATIVTGQRGTGYFADFSVGMPLPSFFGNFGGSTARFPVFGLTSLTTL